MLRRTCTPTTIHANMTPMIDVIFLLIVFFVAVSQIVDREAVSMDLPMPTNPQAGLAEKTNRVVINVIPLENGDVAGILVGGHTISFDDMDGLRGVLQTRLNAGNPTIQLRADRSTNYQHIYAILKAIESMEGTQQVALMIEGESP